jgi:SAM-dependent methyltransferase
MPTFSIENDYLGEFFDPVNYDREVGGDHPSHQFYADLAKRVGGRSLEIACGTGLVAIPLAQQGISITGLDIVPAMLAHAKHKSEALGVSIRWIEGDARNFDLNEKFDFMYMTGNAFQAFLNNSDQRALLQNVRKHLSTGGIFAFETRNPNWKELTTDLKESEWMTYTNDSGYRVRIMETREYDHGAQVLAYTLFRRWQEDAEDKERVTRIAIRYTFPQELNALLEHHGFSILEQYGDWDKSPLKKESPSIISICRMDDQR